MKKTSAVILLSILLAFLIFSCHHERKVSYEEGYINAGGTVKLFYQKVGSGKIKVILPLGLYLYDGLKSLGDSLDCTLVFYDVRNRGRSSHITDSSLIGIWKDVDDLEAIRKHFEFDKVSLVGWSYLGMMVMLYTTQHTDNVDRIVQVGPVPLQWNTTFAPEFTNSDPSLVDSVKSKEMDKLISEGYHLKEPGKFTAQWHEVYLPDLFGDTTNLGRVKEQLLKTIQTENELYGNFVWHLTHHFAGSVQHLNADSLWTEMKKITQPVLTIHGTKDRNAPYGAGRQWAQRISNAKLVTIQGAGHIAWYEKPAAVLHSMKIFLEGNWPLTAEKPN